MKIAIIGAGLSGLSCACELKKSGYSPVIFEKTHELGDKPGNLVALLRLFQTGGNAPMKYIWNRYGMNISPLHPLTKMVVHTPGKTMVSKGNHGHVFLKGTGEGSLERQLAAHANFKILFDNKVELKNVIDEFDKIVVATGNCDIAKELNNWNTSFKSAVRTATVSGSFEPNTLTMWLNKNYSRNGYGYMLVKNPQEAELVLAVSDLDTNDLDFYWKAFLKGEKLNYNIRKTADVIHDVGYPDVLKKDNVYFVGNIGGMMDNFLGFGVVRAIESGIFAARAIMDESLDFDKLMKPLTNEVKRMGEYRKMLNVLTNKDYDIDLSILKLPGIKHLVYNNPLYKARFGVIAPKIIYTYKTYKKKLQSKRPDT